MSDFKFFCKNMLDFSPIKKNKVYRYYYLKTLSTLEFKKIKLNEGKNLVGVKKSLIYFMSKNLKFRQ